MNLEDLDAYISQMGMDQLEELYSFVADYENTPVSITEFIESDEFLGRYFQGKMYPYWKEVLQDIYPTPFYSPYWLVSFRGAIGLGKTTIACTGIAYDLYKLLQMSSPQKGFGLVPSTKILFAIFNVTMSLASDVIWDQLTQMFMQSPYFSKLLGPLGTKKKGRDTLFPKRIDFFLGSRIGHSLGRAVFEAVLDEANFEILKGQMRKSFDSLLRRMESRFMGLGGGVPGKIWVISSETDKSSTINKIIEDYRKSRGVKVVQEPIWVVKPHIYSTNTFPVYKGSDTKPPATIVDSNKHLYEGEPENIIQVPEEHHDAFEADIHEALRDLAGVSIGSSYRLFRLKDRLNKSMAVTPLFPETIQLDFDDDTDQISNYVNIKGYFKNPLSSGVPRFIHIDVGISGDRLGIAASYIHSFKQRNTRDIHTFEEIEESVPTMVTEWAIGIEPTPGKQVPLFKIRGFLQWLSQQGYPIGKITMDGFQSTDTIQQLKKMSYDAALLSMDKTSGPYVAFRNSVYEGRTSLPKHELLKKELLELELTPDGSKVDHPEQGSKDVADAVGGSIYTCIQNTGSARFHQFTEYQKDKQFKSSASEKVKEMFWPGT